MHPLLYRHIQQLAKRYAFEGPFLEIGASPGKKALLAGAYFQTFPNRHAINLQDYAQEGGISFAKCNSNDMRGLFPDGSFRTVLSNAVLEHDKYFWRSIEEIKRVLRPGGLLVIGAPGFVPLKQTRLRIEGANQDGKATITYDVHAPPDYWRFSRQALRAVICEGLELLELKVVGTIPRLVAVARKPGT